MEVRSARKTRGSVAIDDPKPYTRPWTIDMPLQITLDPELIDGMCLENEKSSKKRLAQ